MVQAMDKLAAPQPRDKSTEFILHWKPAVELPDSISQLRRIGRPPSFFCRLIDPINGWIDFHGLGPLCSQPDTRLVIVEEQWPFASISSEIAYRIQKEGFDYLDAPIRRITSADAPLHYAPNLVALALPDVGRTVRLVKEVMYMNK